MVEESKKETQKQVRTHFNLIFIGDQGVGKTCILKRYVNKKFDHNKMATSGVDFSNVKYTSTSGEDCRVKIWDTAG